MRLSGIAIVLALMPAAALARPFRGMRAPAPDDSYLGVAASDDAPIAIDEIRRHAFLGDVMTTLEQSDSPIAKNTVDAIHAGLVRVDTLDRLTVEDCGQLFRENPGLWDGVAAPGDCGKHAPREVLARLSGYSNGNRVYVNPLRNPEDMASTVVHEVNHVANASERHYGSALGIAREEYRAFWVAQQFEDHGRPAGGAWTAWLKRYVIREYGLTGVDPSEISDRPDGNLDNRIAPRVVTMR